MRWLRLSVVPLWLTTLLTLSSTSFSDVSWQNRKGSSRPTASSLNFGALLFVLLRSRRYSGCESTIKGTSRFSERSPGTAVSMGGTSDTPEKWVDVMKRWGRAGSAAAIDEKAGGVKSSEVDASEGEGIKLRQISNNGDESKAPGVRGQPLSKIWRSEIITVHGRTSG
ncbi:hypothetical protein BKA70DRAFT_1226601 [Coprinopsis sp. MPI-PUGE-AT-0042]|nr:hypothetical protein BKA70DRAFT_1226601 [Coprinopsis sp. MPI-PUGE-AT-0042]